MYSLTVRISQLCSNGLDGSLIQMNPVVLGGIILMFLALASGDMSAFLLHEFEAILLGASEFRVLCLHVVAVFDRQISFRVIHIFHLGTNFGNLWPGDLGKRGVLGDVVLEQVNAHIKKSLCSTASDKFTS